MLIMHFTDFSAILLTCGATWAKPTFFQIAFSLSSKDLLIIVCMCWVFFGSSQSWTYFCERITGILSWMWEIDGIASFVKITISLFGV